MSELQARKDYKQRNMTVAESEVQRLQFKQIDADTKPQEARVPPCLLSHSKSLVHASWPRKGAHGIA